MQMYVQDPTPISLPHSGSCTHTGLCTWGTSDWTGYFSSSTTRLRMHTLATTLYQDKLPDMFSSLEKAYHPYIRHPHHTVTQRTPQRCLFRPFHTPFISLRKAPNLVHFLRVGRAQHHPAFHPAGATEIELRRHRP